MDISESLINLGKGWRDIGHSLLLSIPGTQLVWHLPVTRDLPRDFLVGGMGRGRGAHAAAGGGGQRQGWLARQADSEKWNPLAQPVLPLVFSFTGFTGNFSWEGQPLSTRATGREIQRPEEEKKRENRWKGDDRWKKKVGWRVMSKKQKIRDKKEQVKK